MSCAYLSHGAVVSSHALPLSAFCRQYGNLSRFINHSCTPNLTSWHEDWRRRLVLYPNRAIRAGEELTFDYELYSDEIKTPSQTHAHDNQKKKRRGDERWREWAREPAFEWARRSFHSRCLLHAAYGSTACAGAIVACRCGSNDCRQLML